MNSRIFSTDTVESSDTKAYTHNLKHEFEAESTSGEEDSEWEEDSGSDAGDIDTNDIERSDNIKYRGRNIDPDTGSGSSVWGYNPPPFRHKIVQDRNSQKEASVVSSNLPSSEPSWSFGHHFTISRDQTQASSFELARLAPALIERPLKDLKPFSVQQKRLSARYSTDPLAGEPRYIRPVPMREPASKPQIEYQDMERLMLARDERGVIIAGGGSTQDSASNMCTPTVDRAAQRGETLSGQMPSSHVQISQLDHEIGRLHRMKNSLKSTTWLVLHKIKGEKTTYLAEPSWKLDSIDSKNGLRFNGNSPLANEDRYLDQRTDAAFVIYKHYDPSLQEQDVLKAKHDGTAMPDPKPAREVVQALSERMVAALDALVDLHPTFKENFPKWRSVNAINSPFLFWYCYRTSTNFDAIAEPHRKQIQLLTQWIDRNYGKLYADVDEQLSYGHVSESTMPFFIKPGEVLVSKDGKGIQGFIAQSWPTKGHSDHTPSSDSNAPQNVSQSWKVDAWCYKFDGAFYTHCTKLTIPLQFDKKKSYVDIAEQNTLPIRFGSKELRAMLGRRCGTLWACRKRNLIAYHDTSESDLVTEGERYMIDSNTYKQLHPNSNKVKRDNQSLSRPNQAEMDAALNQRDEMPEGSESFVFPGTIVGYNLRQKKWQDLQVDYIQPVHWNKQAFRHLVIDEEIKDIIQALVTSKLATDKTTDFIQGKGSGLIILLHGGPGTGKTFTAESVAEIAEKPLFRVTCGDIGTKPEEVEKYLESVLHLGKIWGCVVLLDEADVFLEQRTLTDLERNALVSVFLRVLEYYEGILILTSNRVGTFDEAFKSRIQLSLHYESLTKSQRRTIWANFLNRLNALEQEEKVVHPITDRKRKLEENPGIDFDDIERHLGDLAEEQMNGRQIRNAITTARQLAKFKNESMTYRHLEHVIKISRKFDKYIERVRDSYTDDQVAREEGIR
ncbi:hypothetical protein NW752_003462 [Fusarium irregulare]|uniref:AAA+ ATPase domain-containing protein n=1 Tax=Fusarium irregulare TaxID=2494466 RepID=A0A9W8PSL9_9HYPO|nr:hypothetical protein NW766_004533 [Fusarium irregulare]KAJ4023005.1 hypothetical protein NW752_003462 [Fusarium irregulare]